MRNTSKFELSFRIGIKILDLVSDFLIFRKSKITYCPLCKTYRVDGAIWNSDLSGLKGKENAKHTYCEGCKNAIQQLRIKIDAKSE